jgi:hypothetical protein
LPGGVGGGSVDLPPRFIEVFNAKAKNTGLRDRVHESVGSMEKISFKKGELYLI